MNGRIKKLLRDSMQLWSLILSMFFMLITAGIVGFFYRQLPPYLPLYNKLAWGYDRLGNTWEISIPFAVMLLFTSGNFFVASYVEEKVPLLGRFLGLTNVGITFFICIFLIKIVFIVI